MVDSCLHRDEAQTLPSDNSVHLVSDLFASYRGGDAVARRPRVIHRQLTSETLRL
jgi:hypothetical protein